MPRPSEHHLNKPPEWTIRCPWCQAAPGQRCTSPRGRRLAIPSHDARTTAYRTEQRHQLDQEDQ